MSNMTANEFDIIDKYFKRLRVESNAVVLGPGDDCAVLSIPTGHELCVSTDTLIEGVHFPEDAPAEIAVSRTMAANLSDLAAMGAEPHAFVLAITMPSADERWLESCSEELSRNIQQYAIPLVGGNLAKGELSLTVTVMGTVPAGESITRSGAKPGDEVYVTGSLGDAAKGLELQRSGIEEGFLVDRYRAPTPRLQAGMGLRGLASAMIDISDGLMSEVGHICASKGYGAEIMMDAIPLSAELLKATELVTATRMALFSGDDYELCFTAAPSKREAIKALSGKLGLPMSRVGLIVDEPGINVRRADGSALPHDMTGYQHF
ncbi:MAG: thiamine-phosphate kinase [Pseudomonadales bacterium]|nr:thiamine-phosphate kinase [Pseudomonadales bacterium]